jgi:hypothetical protein
MRKLFIVAAIYFVAPVAFAVPIQFVQTGIGSGTIGATEFTDEPFTITSLGDTDNRLPIAFFSLHGFYIDHDSSSITIDNVGTFLFLSDTRTFVNTDLPEVGFSRAGDNGSDLYYGPTNESLATWDMLTSTGPFSGSGNLLQWGGELNTPIVTDGR